ncbi:MAG TPA: hypothetical protein VEG61_08005 [Candidatus Dormibacteraeota bacterium]|nr:hypothetical protein [Candidatus Dormibacteraeota bacterium]
MKTIGIDRQGSVVIPKDVREQSGTLVSGQLVVSVEGSAKSLSSQAKSV